MCEYTDAMFTPYEWADVNSFVSCTNEIYLIENLNLRI